jgi:hypothetical protein
LPTCRISSSFHQGTFLLHFNKALIQRIRASSTRKTFVSSSESLSIELERAFC